MRKLSPGVLEVGKPLPFDCFDVEGRLLLKCGLVPDSLHQLEELIERGLFADVDETGAKSHTRDAAVPHLVNPFDLLDRCKSRLTALLNQMRIDNAMLMPEAIDLAALKSEYRANVAMRCAAPDAREIMGDGLSGRIFEIATVIQKTCRLDADAALGYVHLGMDGRYAIMHPLHCAVLVEILGGPLGLTEEQRQPLIAAALTANLSILNLQERLHKQEGELSLAQRGLLGLHPTLSREMLLEAGIENADWLQAVALHHERFDGSGYPNGMAKEAIPLAARLVALADIYDAMIKPRAYRTPFASKDALCDIFIKRGSKVDEDMAQALIKELSIYPPGSFVRLKNGEIAVVFRRGRTATTPLVRSVIGPRGAPLDRPVRRDTSETMHPVAGHLPYDPTVRIDFRLLWDYDRN